MVDKITANAFDYSRGKTTRKEVEEGISKAEKELKRSVLGKDTIDLIVKYIETLEKQELDVLSMDVSSDGSIELYVVTPTKMNFENGKMNRISPETKIPSANIKGYTQEEAAGGEIHLDGFQEIKKVILIPRRTITPDENFDKYDKIIA